MDTLEKVLPRTIFLTVAGSHLYGTNIETSDYDFKGVCVATSDYYYGYLNSFEDLERKVEKGHPHDLTITTLWKYIKLAGECNPNVVELLFAKPHQIVHMDEFGEELVSLRRHFLTTKARHTYSGYAHQQLHRIESHRKWLLEPPKEKPTRKMYELPEQTKISKSEMGAFNALPEDRHVEIPSDVMKLYLAERRYQSALTNWKQYENWQENRNDVRFALEAKYGYDTKHAMHLVRLMRQCVELLSTGEMNVFREDAHELLDVRYGKWPYEKIKQFAVDMDLKCAELYKTSKLPHDPDRVFLNKVCIDMTERYLRKHG